MSFSNWTHIDVAEILRETDDAFLLRLKKDKEDYWVPRSVIADPGNYSENDTNCTVSIQDWFCEKSGLE